MSKIIVTGGAGFIGSNIVEKFLKLGHEVAVIDNLETGYLENLPKAGTLNFSFKQTSVTSEDAVQFIEAFKPNTIVHLAAQMNVRRSVSEPVFDAEQNIVGTIKMLQAASAVGVSEFFFSSTGGAIYGEQDYFPADEQHPINPECPYGLSKRCAELYIKYYTEQITKTQPEFRSVAFRFGNVYGPRQNPRGEAGVVAIFSKKSLGGKDLTINGDGSQTRDFIFVYDVVNAILAVKNQKQNLKTAFSIYNLGTGVETDINQISQLIKSLVERDYLVENLKILKGPPAPGEQMRSLLDASKFKTDFSWKPEYDVEAGIKETLRFFSEQGEE